MCKHGDLLCNIQELEIWVPKPGGCASPCYPNNIIEGEEIEMKSLRNWKEVLTWLSSCFYFGERKLRPTHKNGLLRVTTSLNVLPFQSKPNHPLSQGLGGAMTTALTLLITTATNILKVGQRHQSKKTSALQPCQIGPRF